MKTLRNLIRPLATLYCSNCGHGNSDGSTYCSNCGKMLNP